MACTGDCYLKMGFSASSCRSSSSSPSRFSLNKGLLLYTATSPRLGAKCRNSKILRFPASVFRKMRRTGAMQISKAESQESTSKKANLFAERKKIIKLPNYSDGCGRVYPFKEFLSHPLGMESILNTRALQSFQSLDSNTYRCTLPKLQFLSFEVSPVLVLRVTTTSEDCTVEMLSCKFEGSKVFERQSENFSALMRNHITWDVTGHEPCLAVDVKLYVTLEVFTRPFTLLPISAIETPGNLAIQGLVDRLVQLFVQQLYEDYEKWVQEQSKISV
ncbi:DUF1997 family protein, putative (DUF1997) isoform X2 [Tasmannia lanceolata]|uniref:DUF1997 family protein, putative (DUF1997) isoform X2 n=1 Tax=Tasmannia lanceolata TaxID=3420 RepID=UPI0040638FEC